MGVVLDQLGARQGVDDLGDRLDGARDTGVVDGNHGAHRVVHELGEVSGIECERRLVDVAEQDASTLRAKASAVLTKPNEGTTTVSPGPMSSSIAVISSADVQDVVSRTSWPGWLRPAVPTPAC